jgi:putative ABC transport system substrate-binding protein
MIQRREFIALIGGAAVAWPLVAQAQTPTNTQAQQRSKIPLVGVLLPSSAELSAARLQSFRDGLRQNGFVEVTPSP